MADVIDQQGREWIVSEGDPGWPITKHARMKMLLEKPVIPTSMLLAGMPDASLADAEEELLGFDSVVKQIPWKTQRTVWPKVRRRFQCWMIQSSFLALRAPDEESGATDEDE